MSWTVEADDAYEKWLRITHPTQDADTRITLLEFVHSWSETGPPDDADFDPSRETLSCAVPGTRVEVEFVSCPYLDPPVVIVLAFR